MVWEQLMPEEDEEPTIGLNPWTLAMALVFITIILAAALSFWASGIGVKKSEGLSECSSTQFRLYSGSYDINTSSMLLVLENLGSKRISGLTLYLFYSDAEMIEKPIGEDLESSKIKSYNFTEVPVDFKNGVIKTSCPEVSIEFIQQNGVLIES